MDFVLALIRIRWPTSTAGLWLERRRVDPVGFVTFGLVVEAISVVEAEVETLVAGAGAGAVVVAAAVDVAGGVYGVVGGAVEAGADGVSHTETPP